MFLKVGAMFAFLIALVLHPVATHPPLVSTWGLCTQATLVLLYIIISVTAHKCIFLGHNLARVSKRPTSPGMRMATLHPEYTCYYYPGDKCRSVLPFPAEF